MSVLQMKVNCKLITMVLIEINTSWLCLQIYAKLVHHKNYIEKLAETFVTYLDCPTL